MSKPTKSKQEIRDIILKRVWKFGLTIVVAGLLATFSKYGFYEKWQLDEEKSKIVDDLQNQTRMRDSLRLVVKRLNTDMIEIERLARERYGMIKPGEEVLFVPSEQEKD